MNSTYFNQDNSLEPFVGISPYIQRLRQVIVQIAQSDAPVLLCGESGTDKVTIAATLHKLSLRKNNPYGEINCGLISPKLLEIELFGQEQNLTTPTVAQNPGRFELLNKGTLFLNEIAELSLSTQKKLLRIFQENKYEPIDSTNSHETDVRLIVATEQNLENLIEQEKFRKDLFYKLNVFSINTEPLRKRNEDIPYLISYFIKEIGQRLNKTISFTSHAINALTTYSWPGNLKELANFVERFIILYPNSMVDIDKIEDLYLPNKQTFPESGLAFNAKQPYDLKGYLENTEIKLITQALQENRGNVSRTAKHLAVGRTTLIEKMKRLKIKSQQQNEN